MKLSRVFLKGYVACPVLKLDIIALLLQSSWYRCREALEVILSDKAILSQMKVFHQKIDTVWNFHLITFDWLCFHLAILVNKCCLAGKASCALKQATQASLSLQVMILCSVKMNSCSLDTWSTSPALHRAGRKFFFFYFSVLLPVLLLFALMNICAKQESGVVWARQEATRAVVAASSSGGLHSVTKIIWLLLFK